MEKCLNCERLQKACDEARAVLGDLVGKVNRRTQQRNEARAEVATWKSRVEQKSEQLAVKLGERGADVSGCYDYEDLVSRLDVLVHEVELEKERARSQKLLEALDAIAGHFESGIGPFDMRRLAQRAIAEYQAQDSTVEDKK